MHPNHALIERLYAGLAAKDGEAMAACYAPEARFTDPVFDVEGGDVGDMWRMLTSRAGEGFRAEVKDVWASGGKGSAMWDAWYTFSATGRKVHNTGRATFVFKDGKIVDHQDDFDFHAWASQALGWKGKLLGKTLFLKRKVSGQAMAGLRKFQQGRAK